jgi:hypothetical protein
VDVVLLSAAIADRPDQWDDIDQMGRLVNVYSRDDLALRVLYPLSVGSDDTPAAGLGPIRTPSNNVVNIDATDTIGTDHLWAADNVSRLVRWSIASMGDAARSTPVDPFPEIPSIDPPSSPQSEDETRGRLLRWVLVDRTLWDDFGSILAANKGVEGDLIRWDAWSLHPGRLEVLLEVGRAASVLVGDRSQASERDQRSLSGLVRAWVGLGNSQPSVGSSGSDTGTGTEAGSLDGVLTAGVFGLVGV